MSYLYGLMLNKQSFSSSDLINMHICEVYVNVHILCSVQVSFIFLWYVGATIKSTGGDSIMKWPGMLVGNFELNP